MGHSQYTKVEIAARGRAIYEQQLRAKLEPGHKGKFLIIDIWSGDYEVDEDEFAASRRAHAKHPDGAFFGMRVGYRTNLALLSISRFQAAASTCCAQAASASLSGGSTGPR
jgi:hypothetical protein